MFSIKVWITALTTSLCVGGLCYGFPTNCTFGRFGRGCRLSCHCAKKENCHKKSGECTSGCALGWSGVTCQRLNIALKKPAWQSSDLYTKTAAGLAVDGLRNDVHPNCAHTGWEAEAIWRVDLRAYRPIDHVSIVARADCCASRLRGFMVYVANSTNSTGGLCYKHSMSSPPKIIDIKCERPLKGQYVVIKNVNAEPLTLCEVEIFKCADFTFGDACMSACNCRSTMEVCNKRTGRCRTGCAPGWRGDNCTLPCPDRKYGAGCALSCRCDNATEVCDKVTGRCASGCAPGRTGRGCRQVCPNWRFGPDCIGHCRCAKATEVCKKSTGQCVSGCAPGVTGLACQQPCPDNFFGSGCHKRCHCRDPAEICKKTTGHCLSGCASGWSALACSTPCPAGRYGVDCAFTCNCGSALDGDTSGECDSVTGACPSGCLLGWSGVDCKECADGFFGQGCTRTCNCLLPSDVCNKTSGECSGACFPGWSGTNCQEKIIDPTTFTSVSSSDRQSDLSPDVVRGVGGGVAAVIGFAVLVATIVFVIRRRKQKAKPLSATDVNGNDAEANNNYEGVNSDPPRDLHDGHAYEEVETINEATDGPTFVIKHAGVKCAELRPYVDKLLQQPSLLDAEFQSLPAPQKTGYDCSCRVENIGKNRYKRILPYDQHRVILDVSNNEATSDYINASFIAGYKKQKAYIASQGPTEELIGDFWLMVWQQKTGKIVMLTGLSEAGRKKCDQYWPEGKVALQAGCLTVEHLLTETYAHYIIRTFKLGKGESVRTVKQFHLTTWNDHEAPADTIVLLMFREKMHETNVEMDGPILVHCSAGVGRSGTFIALDYLVMQAEDTGSVNFDLCVRQMRTQRMSMIQTKAQYEFLHKAVSDALSYRGNPTSAADFTHVYHKIISNDGDSPSQIQREFDTLCSDWFAEKSTKYLGALTRENITKNRNSEILASAANRVFLSTNVKGRNDYINAVFLPSYTRRNAMIVTQLPTADTVVDFWRLVYEQKPSCIVLLDSNLADDSENGEEPCLQYWPDFGEEMKTGNLIITTDTETDGEAIKTRTFTVASANDIPDLHHVTQICTSGWAQYKVNPESPTVLLNLIDAVNQYLDKDHPSIIQCRDGSERCGLYACVSILLERLKSDQQVNVLQTTRQVKASRRQFLNDVGQYRFCYDTVLAYLNPEKQAPTRSQSIPEMNADS